MLEKVLFFFTGKVTKAYFTGVVFNTNLLPYSDNWRVIIFGVFIFAVREASQDVI